jgi:hypothetical protein
MRQREPERAAQQSAKEKSARAHPRLPQPSAQSAVNKLQQTVGNAAVISLLASGAIQAKLRVSEPGDADEVEADRVADQVVGPSTPAVHRKCATGTAPDCEEEEVESAKGIHRKASGGSDERASVAEDFAQSLGSGQPLESGVRGQVEAAFGLDFHDVRIHTNSPAATHAKALNARAFTVGPHIVFSEGEYAPQSHAGAKLLAHELAHTVQDRRSNSPSTTTIKRQSSESQEPSWFSKKTAQAGKWLDEKKWAVYRAMIAGLKSAKTAGVNQMRGLVPRLPNALQGAASAIIDVVDFFQDMVIALLLAIVGLAVGFVEGIVGLVVGLVKLALGLIKMTIDYIVSLMGKPEEYQKDVNDLVAAIKGIPSGLTRIKDEWLERYKRATLEEQVLMGGELVGQIEAFIATFAFAGTKAGQATAITLRGGEAAAQVTTKGALVLQEAPAITVAIPAVVPKTAAEAAVVSSQMMMSASGGGGASSGPGAGGKTPFSDLSDEEIDKAVENMKPAGDPVQLQPHRGATSNRKALGMSGKDVQSAHGAPQSVMKRVPGYNPNDALTKLMDRAVHQGVDEYWKQSFRAMRGAGRTQAKAQEIYDIVAESIRRAPGLSAGEKNSLIARLSDEMFVEYGLQPNDVLDLPYANIPAK